MLSIISFACNLYFYLTIIRVYLFSNKVLPRTFDFHFANIELKVENVYMITSAHNCKLILKKRWYNLFENAISMNQFTYTPGFYTIINLKMRILSHIASKPGRMNHIAHRYSLDIYKFTMMLGNGMYTQQKEFLGTSKSPNFPAKFHIRPFKSIS